jgi:hypothetical protein
MYGLRAFSSVMPEAVRYSLISLPWYLGMPPIPVMELRVSISCSENEDFISGYPTVSNRVVKEDVDDLPESMNEL